MYGHGKCPKCGEPVSRCDLDKVIVGDSFGGPFFHGVAICCANPQCHSVLSVSVDPTSLAADIVDRVVRKIQGKNSQRILVATVNVPHILVLKALTKRFAVA